MLNYTNPVAAAVHNMKIPLGNVHIMLTNRFFVIVIYLCMFNIYTHNKHIIIYIFIFKILYNACGMYFST